MDRNKTAKSNVPAHTEHSTNWPQTNSMGADGLQVWKCSVCEHRQEAALNDGAGLTRTCGPAHLQDHAFRTQRRTSPQCLTSTKITIVNPLSRQKLDTKIVLYSSNICHRKKIFSRYFQLSPQPVSVLLQLPQASQTLSIRSSALI